MLQGYSDREDDHYKLAVSHIDYVLSQIEKFNFFTSKLDYFSKIRLFPIIGLSCGLGIECDDILKGNIKE